MRRFLVTGGSAGIGQAVVNALAKKCYQVVTTSRQARVSLQSDLIQWRQLDLGSPENVSQFCNSDIWDQPFDAVFNNAGFGLIAPIESADDEAVRTQFEANYFGTMALTRRAMAHFRDHDRGTLMVNTSIGGRMAFPYFGYYNATKHALEASYEALWYECLKSSIRIKLIEPGFTQTKFATSGMRKSGHESSYHQEGLESLSLSMKKGTTATPPAVVAETVVRALFDQSDRLRYHAGKHSGTLLMLRKLLPDRLFKNLIGKAVLRG